MNICFFLGGLYQNGGIGRITALLANQLTGLNIDQIYVLCYFNPNRPNMYPLSSKIKQHFFLESYSSMTKQLLSGGVLRLRHFLKENNIDILIACGALFYPISVLACKGTKTRSICWEHSDPEGNNDHRGQYLARKFGIKRSDMNIVLTKQALKVFIEKYHSNNTIQIYNPVDEAVFKAASDYDINSSRIISVGRLTYQKNFQVAIKVASEILPKHPDWQWDVYGQGEDLEELVKLTKENGIEKQMHFCGQVADLYSRYKEYSFMVMTSRYEGFPMTLLEGCGNGLPLVSFDIPTGPNEIIDDGENGFLLSSEDCEGMIMRIVQLIENKDLRRKMSYRSKEKSKSFMIQDVCNEWYKALQSVMGNARD